MKLSVILPQVAGTFLACSTLLAQELPKGKPDALGFSAERLALIGTTVQKDIDDKLIAGEVTLVIRHGKVAWFEAEGMSDREKAIPMQKDSIFRICSMTKPITSTAVMQLYEQGKITLDDPISMYLPEFKDEKIFVKGTGYQADYSVPVTREITIRDLLRHTSGLTYPWNDKLGKLYKDANVSAGLEQYDGTIGDSVKRLAPLPLLFNPGDKFEYSLGVDVLGRLVEVVSGMPLDEYFRTMILAPLGMKDTCFYPTESQVGRFTTAYTYYPGKGLAAFPDSPIVEGSFSYTADYPIHGPKKLFSGGAGLCSTAMDYARFCQMILNGGELNGAHILSRKSVELMTHDQLGKIDPDSGFGLGFGVSGIKSPLRDLGSPGEFGWGGFFYTSFNIDPKEDMIVISMGQLHPTGNLTLNQRVQNLAYQALNN